MSLENPSDNYVEDSTSKKENLKKFMEREVDILEETLNVLEQIVGKVNQSNIFEKAKGFLTHDEIDKLDTTVLADRDNKNEFGNGQGIKEHQTEAIEKNPDGAELFYNQETVNKAGEMLKKIKSFSVGEQAQNTTPTPKTPDRFLYAISRGFDPVLEPTFDDKNREIIGWRHGIAGDMPVYKNEHPNYPDHDDHVIKIDENHFEKYGNLEDFVRLDRSIWEINQLITGFENFKKILLDLRRKESKRLKTTENQHIDKPLSETSTDISTNLDKIINEAISKELAELSRTIGNVDEELDRVTKEILKDIIK